MTEGGREEGREFPSYLAKYLLIPRLVVGKAECFVKIAAVTVSSSSSLAVCESYQSLFLFHHVNLSLSNLDSLIYFLNIFVFSLGLFTKATESLFSSLVWVSNSE